MTIRKYTMSGVTDGTAAATVYSPWISGYLESIQYIKHGSNPLSDGSTMTFTADVTGEAVWAQTAVNASATVRPRTATHTTAGVAASYDGTRATLDRIALGRDRLKCVISSGGNAKNFSYVITIDDPR